MENTASNKKLDAIHASSMRELLTVANKLGIQKEDFVQIIPSEGFFLVFYS